LRERKKGATKERIYREALELFRRQGFAHTTVEEIAEAAEVSKGTFFNYFETKEAVLHLLGERQAAATARALASVRDDLRLNTRRKLERMLEALIATAEADRELTCLAVFKLAKAPEAALADPYRNQVRQAVTSLMREGQRYGEVARRHDPEWLSSAITGIYFQQIFEWCAAPQPGALRLRVNDMIEMLWRGVVGSGEGE
jgi:AcrR family transcriptional regulator